MGSQSVLDSQESGSAFASNFRRNLFVCVWESKEKLF